MLAAVGCSDDLPRASTIAAMRVLGARMEVEGDAERSTPKPGEIAHVTWSMAYPDLTQDDSELSTLLATCTAPKDFSGVPICQELIDVARGGSLVDVLSASGALRKANCKEKPDDRIEAGPFTITCVTGTPRSDVKVEAGYKGDAKLIQGIICRNGTPVFDQDEPTGARCEPKPGVKANKVESIAVYGTVPIQHKDKDANHNPTLDAARFGFGKGGVEWPALTPEESQEILPDCAQAAVDLRVVSSSGKNDELSIEYDASARELYEGDPEPLEFSTYVTMGELDRRFTVFGPDSKKPFKSKLKWNVDRETRDKYADKPRLVRFYFTLLDHRGGFSITARDVCVGRDLATDAQK